MHILLVTRLVDNVSLMLKFGFPSGSNPGELMKIAWDIKLPDDFTIMYVVHPQ